MECCCFSQSLRFVLLYFSGFILCLIVFSLLTTFFKPIHARILRFPYWHTRLSLCLAFNDAHFILEDFFLVDFSALILFTKKFSCLFCMTNFRFIQIDICAEIVSSNYFCKSIGKTEL